MSHFTKFISVQLPAIGDPYYTLTEALRQEHSRMVDLDIAK